MTEFWMGWILFVLGIGTTLLTVAVVLSQKIRSYLKRKLAEEESQHLRAVADRLAEEILRSDEKEVQIRNLQERIWVLEQWVKATNGPSL